MTTDQSAFSSEGQTLPSTDVDEATTITDYVSSLGNNITGTTTITTTPTRPVTSVFASTTLTTLSTTEACPPVNDYTLYLALGLGIPLLIFMVATIVLGILLHKNRRKSTVQKCTCQDTGPDTRDGGNAYVVDATSTVLTSPIVSTQKEQNNDNINCTDLDKTKHVSSGQIYLDMNPTHDNPQPGTEYDFYQVDPNNEQRTSSNNSDQPIYQNYGSQGDDNETYANYDRCQDQLAREPESNTPEHVALPTRKKNAPDYVNLQKLPVH